MQKKESAFTRNFMESYLKFCFIQCTDTDQLPRPQCVICATVSEMKLLYEAIATYPTSQYKTFRNIQQKQ